VVKILFFCFPAINHISPRYSGLPTNVYKLTTIVIFVDWLYFGNRQTISFCSHLCEFKWPGRLAAVCALSGEIINKGQLTTLIVGMPRQN
jgi:hypothetical protein